MAPGRDTRRPAETDVAGFTRLWTAFMSARVLMAVAILAMHLAVHTWVRPVPLWILGACAVYLALTLLVRLLARPRGPGVIRAGSGARAATARARRPRRRRPPAEGRGA